MSTTVGDLAETAIEFLKERGISEPELSVQWLLADSLGVSRLELPLLSGRRLSKGQERAFWRRVERRGRGEPLQYILGYWEFWDFQLRVDSRVLIPRPETEQLVELVIQLAKGREIPEGGAFLDLGTGSGAIALALALEFPEAELWASDLSASALELARENAESLGVLDRINFVQGDLFGPFEGSGIKFDLIVSNPPYIPEKEMKNLSREVLDFEPELALNGGPDGIAVLREILKRGRDFLKNGGFIACEIDLSHGQKLLQLAEKFGYTEANLFKDFTGRKRFLVVRKKSL